MRLVPSLVVVALLLSAASCAPPPRDLDDDAGPTAGRAIFAFEPLEVGALPSRWGAPAAGGFLIGGVDASMRVSDTITALAVDDGALVEGATSTLDVPRFCGCAMFDEGRRELIVIGGRDEAFRDAASAVLIDVDSGERVALDDGGAADHPVGCHAFFSPTRDRGYVFGGAASASGFSGATWRFDPSARAFTALDAAGPPARYDGGVVTLADGGALVVGGMGGTTAPTFYADVWRFDATDESWSALVASAPGGPPGRRVPWVALAPDETTLLYGFGSDSPRGDSVLGDLWRLELPSGEWSAAEVEGEHPAARGFTQRLPAPAGFAGVLAFGSDAELNLHGDAYVVAVPDDLSGSWR